MINKKIKRNVFVGVIVALVIGGFIMLSNKNSSSKVTYYGNDTSKAVSASTNVSTEGDKQVIEIVAKGGYSPTATVAKANMPTILRVKTNGTYDCSTNLRIKSLSYSNNLPATGITDIEVPAQTDGATIAGLCSMGMYHFAVNFKS